MTCGTCRFSDPHVGDDEGLFLECVRFPPTPVVLDNEVVMIWAQVSAEDECGEFQEANP